MEEITIYKFQLEEIQDALRMAYDLHDCGQGKTCFARTVSQARKYAQNALKGEKDKFVSRL